MSEPYRLPVYVAVTLGLALVNVCVCTPRKHCPSKNNPLGPDPTALMGNAWPSASVGRTTLDSKPRSSIPVMPAMWAPDASFRLGSPLFERNVRPVSLDLC